MATVATVPRFDLASGDRLTRAEFERRYAALPENLKCELIEGVVYMASPLRYESHADHLPLLAGSEGRRIEPDMKYDR